MKDTFLIGIIQNTALLLAFSMLYDYFWIRNVLHKSILFKIGTGLIMGCVGIVLILTPWTFKEGLIFDTRSVMLSISGLFFGPIPTLIAMLMLSIYRFVLGGPGTLMGILVIISSGAIGILWRHFRPGWINKKPWQQLIAMGFLVHLVMICCIFSIPEQFQAETFSNMAFPVIIVYPLATLLLGILMIRQTENWNNKHALDLSEERWHFALEGTGDGVWDRNLQTNEIFLSEQWKKMLGYEKHEIENSYDEWEKRVFPEDKERVLQLTSSTIRGEKAIYEAEYRILCKDGTYKWILDRGKIISYDESGKPLRFIGTHRDISNRKVREMQLAHERFLVDALMNSTPESIFFKDLDSRFIRVNNASAQSMGCKDASEAIGKTNFDFYPEEIARKTHEIEQEIIRTGKPYSEESKRTRLDGSESWVIINKMPLLNPEGKIIGTFGTSINITERKKYEQALKESEKYTNSILRAIPDLIFILSANGIYLDFKSGNQDDLYLPKDGFINKSIFTILPDDVAGKIMEKIDETLEHQTVSSLEYILSIKGEDNIFECLILPFGTDRVIAMVRNITTRKQVEDALKKSQEQLKKFAAHLQDVREEERVLLAREIHDELGQILIAMKIDLGILKQKMNKPTTSKQELEQKFAQVLNLVDRTIRTTRKIMTGLRPEMLELLGLTEAARLYTAEFEARHRIKCNFECTVTELKINSQESIALFRILQEGLTNVAKHSQATEVKVNLKVNSSKLEFKIADNGIGFDQTKPKRQDSYGLIGIQERVFLLSGKLTINSGPGKGTNMSIEMPYNNEN